MKITITVHIDTTDYSDSATEEFTPGTSTVAIHDVCHVRVSELLDSLLEPEGTADPNLTPEVADQDAEEDISEVSG